MAKLLTLRNIITLFALLFLTACNKSVDESNITVHQISSEDDDNTVIGSVSDPETGQQVYIIVSK
jgi:hypothetical protein